MAAPESRTSKATVVMRPETEGRDSEILRVFQTRAETKAFYDKIARFYDLLAEHSEEPMRKAGLSRLAALPGEDILEIGFGTGHSVVELAKAVGPTGKIYGIDLSSEMHRIATQLVARNGLTDRVNLVRGDAAQLPFDSESMDGVFTSFTLELFDTPEIPGVLAECKRVLRPNGRLVVVSVSKNARPGLVLRAFEWTHRHFPNLMDCRPIFVQKALEDASFAIRHAETKHMWVPVEIVLGVKEI